MKIDILNCNISRNKNNKIRESAVNCDGRVKFCALFHKRLYRHTDRPVPTELYNFVSQIRLLPEQY